MNIDGKKYSKEQLRDLCQAVKRVLVAPEPEIVFANGELLNVAITIGLVDINDCNLG